MKNDSIFIEYSIIPSLHDMEIQLAQTLVKRQNCFWKAPTCTCNTVTKHQCHVKCLLTCLYMILFSKHFIFLLPGKNYPSLPGRHPNSCPQTLPGSLMEFGLHLSLLGGNGTQFHAKSSALPHFVLLQISPSSLGPGFQTRVSHLSLPGETQKK